MFDISQEKSSDAGAVHEYIPFNKTVLLCEKWGLPCVAYRHEPNLQLKAILNELSQRPRYKDVEGELEGYVIRDFSGSRIAKIRVEDLLKIDYNSKVEFRTCKE